jgi:hypothetical protein
LSNKASQSLVRHLRILSVPSPSHCVQSWSTPKALSIAFANGNAYDHLGSKASPPKESSRSFIGDHTTSQLRRSPFLIKSIRQCNKHHPRLAKLYHRTARYMSAVTSDGPKASCGGNDTTRAICQSIMPVMWRFSSASKWLENAAG